MPLIFHIIENYGGRNLKTEISNARNLFYFIHIVLKSIFSLDFSLLLGVVQNQKFSLDVVCNLLVCFPQNNIKNSGYKVENESVNTGGGKGKMNRKLGIACPSASTFVSIDK